MSCVQGMKQKQIYQLLFVAFFVRLLLASIPGFRIDVTAWYAWAIRMYELGPSHFYSPQVWTNYTPGFLYVLWFLGMLHHAFQIDTTLFYYILKLPAILADLGLGWLVYKELKNRVAMKYVFMAVMFIVLNPALIFNSTVWGQVDSILTLFIFLSISSLRKNKLYLAIFFLALSFLIKPQAVAVFPIYVLWIFSKRTTIALKLRHAALSSLFFIGTLFLFSIPFFAFHIVPGLFTLLRNMVGDYPYTSLFAYNLWGIVGFWKSDSILFLGLSYQQISILLFIAFWLLIGFMYHKKHLSLYSLATLACLAFYFLPTRSHDRYLFPAIPFLVISAFEYLSSSLMYLSILISVLHFFNLYYVYVYYNEIYAKLPHMLYYEPIYHYLDSNGSVLSFASMVAFLVISFELMVVKEKDHLL